MLLYGSPLQERVSRKFRNQALDEFLAAGDQTLHFLESRPSLLYE